jgi:2-C-methyl-D-erythritol 4-phosphate cytidylyltransferase
VERIGKKVTVVQGDLKNIKITTPEDIKIVEAFLEN